MTKKNLPNIPLYIGDWEKDCNVLSLESEAAWLRIIFKMFTSGKQSTYKLPTKGLQNLWRVSEEKANEIIEELIDYNICEIQLDGRFIEFKCRRFEKENEISEIRKDAVSNRKDRVKKPKKVLQKFYKNNTKDVQNTEIEIENESEYENKNEIVVVTEKEGMGEKEKPFPTFSEFWKYTADYIHEKKLGETENWKIPIEAKYNAWKENNWKDGNGNKISNWKTKIQNTIPYLKPINNGAKPNLNQAIRR